MTVYAQAETIRQHATAGAEGTAYEGKTYAELGTMVREAQDAGDEALAEELQTRRALLSSPQLFPSVYQPWSWD